MPCLWSFWTMNISKLFKLIDWPRFLSYQCSCEEKNFYGLFRDHEGDEGPGWHLGLWGTLYNCLNRISGLWEWRLLWGELKLSFEYLFNIVESISMEMSIWANCQCQSCYVIILCCDIMHLDYSWQNNPQLPPILCGVVSLSSCVLVTLTSVKLICLVWCWIQSLNWVKIPHTLVEKWISLKSVGGCSHQVFISQRMWWLASCSNNVCEQRD